MINVLITNTVLLNAGDAAILYALIDHVTSVCGDDANIVVADTHSAISSEYYPTLKLIKPLYQYAFHPRKTSRFRALAGLSRYVKWYLNQPRLYLAAFLLGRGAARLARMMLTTDERGAAQYYQEADVIISTGGTYLVENYWLALQIFEFRIALLLRKPLVLYTQSLGPFKRRRIRRALRRIFERAALILLRDEKSMEHVHEICDTASVNAHEAADTAFSLANPQAIELAMNMERNLSPRIAISVRDWPYFSTVDMGVGMARYLTAIADMCQHLLETHRASIEFISTCQGVPAYAYDDSKVAAEVVSRLDGKYASRIVIDTEFHRPEDLRLRLQSYDIVVSTRMHVAILALCSGTIPLPISYEFKTTELFRRLGMQSYIQDIEKIESRTLIGAMDQLLVNAAAVRRDVLPKVIAECRRAFLASEHLARVLQDQ